MTDWPDNPFVPTFAPPEVADYALPGGAPWCVHVHYVPGCVPCLARNNFPLGTEGAAEWDRIRLTDPAPSPTVEQRMPTPNTRPAIADLVIDDLRERKRMGTATYGTPLQAFNGRDPLVDAYQESIDQTQYLRQAIDERAAIMEAARRLTAEPEETIRTEVQGTCVFCGAGWVPDIGPRGGDRGLRLDMSVHADDCPFDGLRNLVRASG